MKLYTHTPHQSLEKRIQNPLSPVLASRLSIARADLMTTSWRFAAVPYCEAKSCSCCDLPVTPRCGVATPCAARQCDSLESLRRQRETGRREPEMCRWLHLVGCLSSYSHLECTSIKIVKSINYMYLRCMVLGGGYMVTCNCKPKGKGERGTDVSPTID